ncbi:hypothetical protein B9T36_13245 [Acinetobacter sp. ANC 4204]|uniref:DUF2059 domain-containing protein n=1 Tax=unclassified Acinetobacter TaxID=196816 RepID=UPI000A356F80|nr:MULTISPECIES: DUF2059 domain-containing protein [unclassified Acinetobacter]OTG57927.1 hypothetical protein B9T36_13245 [Acinetobacter sp. ANC 4204]
MKKLNHMLYGIALCVLSTASFAKPATEASVEKALKLGDIKGTLAQSQQEMRPVYDQQAEEIIKNIFKTSTLNPEQQKAAKQIAEITASFSSKLISDPKFMQMLKDVYMQTFTEEEVLANIQFLETPLGQSINKKSSKMMSEIMRNSIAMSAEMMQDPAIQQEMNRQIEKTLTPLFDQAKKAK